MNINLKFLEKDLIETFVPVPLSGTLSGHAAGEPFDKHVYKFIKNNYPSQTFRQFEYLNNLYLMNPLAISVKDKHDLIGVPALKFLINRGTKSTLDWSKNSLFEEKQDDTADIIVIDNQFMNIIDVKTYNISKKGQPPNIISAYKVAKMCALMIESKIYNSHDITYISIAWEQKGDKLFCKNAVVKELFKAKPESLYINWAAALQIQFSVDQLDQSFTGSVEEWCKQFIRVFVSQAEERSLKMISKFVDPFIVYLK